MPACFIARGLLPNLSTILLKRVGRYVPDIEVIRFVCAAFVTGIMPGITGWNIPLA